MARCAPHRNISAHDIRDAARTYVIADTRTPPENLPSVVKATLSGDGLVENNAAREKTRFGDVLMESLTCDLAHRRLSPKAKRKGSLVEGGRHPGSCEEPPACPGSKEQSCGGAANTCWKANKLLECSPLCRPDPTRGRSWKANNHGWRRKDEAVCTFGGCGGCDRRGCIVVRAQKRAACCSTDTSHKADEQVNLGSTIGIKIGCHGQHSLGAHDLNIDDAQQTRRCSVTLLLRASHSHT